MNFLLVIFTVCGIGGIGLMILFFILLRRKKKQEAFGKQKERRTDSNQYQKSYIIFSKNILFKRYILKIRKRFEIVADYSEHELRYKTMNTFFIAVAIILLIILAMVFMSGSILNMLLAFILLYFFAESIVDILVVRLVNKILNEQIGFNKKVKHYYYEYNDIRDAIGAAAEELVEDSPEISRIGMKIYDILSSKETEENINAFNENAPNRFLKMFLGLVYTTMEYGDTRDQNGRSQLIENLSDLNKEIQIELFKREKIMYTLSSLNIITIIPLIFIAPLKIWLISSFYATHDFFNGNIGIIMDILVYLVIFASYYLVRKIQDDGSIKSLNLDQKVLKLKFVRKIMQVVVPIKHTRRREKIETLIKEAGSNISIEEYYLRKMLVASAMFVFSFLLILYLHNNTKKDILLNPETAVLSNSMISGKPNAEDMKIAVEYAKKDAEIMALSKYSADEESIKQAATEIYGAETAAMAKTIDRLMNKTIRYNNNYFKWYEMLICLSLALIGYQIFTLILAIQKNINKIEMENEVSMFQSIILMLMNLDRINVYELLEWLSSYSIIFKSHLERCLTDYDAGSEEALIALKESVEYKPFVELINNLQNANNNLSIAAAFDELKREKEHFFKVREEVNGRTIEKKKNIATLIGFMPIYAVIILYLIVPIFYVSVAQMQTIFNQLSNI